MTITTITIANAVSHTRLIVKEKDENNLINYFLRKKKEEKTVSR